MIYLFNHYSFILDKFENNNNNVIEIIYIKAKYKTNQ